MRALTLSLLGLALFACKPAAEADPEGGQRAKADGVTTPAKTVEGRARIPGPDAPVIVCAPVFAPLEQLDNLRARTEIDGRPVVARFRNLSPDPSLSWLADADARLGRVTDGQADDAALVEQWLDALEAGSDRAPALVAGIAAQLRVVAFLDMRRQLAAVADGRLRGVEARAAWTDAACLWTYALRELAERADALEAESVERWTGAWTETIKAGLNAGAKAIDADPTAVKVAKQQIEKSLYAVMFRLIIDDVSQRDPAAASEALGLLDALEDRLADRNSPGLRRMRQQLAGPPAALDPALFERELAVAFAKRARKYCDKASTQGELGQGDAIAETWEGIVYTRVILGLMRDALEPEGFDADAYLADWDGYLAAVTTSDAAVAAEVAARLVEWNCAYQRHLDVAECTASADERE